MARENGRPPADLTGDFFKNPKAYSFFQAIRILRLSGDKQWDGTDETLFRDTVRIRPLLSLSFPGTDVYSVTEAPEEYRARFLLTATFLGLYGAGSPLPTHYTEDLLDEASEDKSVTRDFFDIINNPFYRLFFKSWSRNRWFIKLAEDNAPEYFERLFCLLGLGSEEVRRVVPNVKGLLRYIGLFTQFPRSASGLAALLGDAVDVPNVEVVPNVLRKVRIPEPQKCSVGVKATTLGRDCHIGEEIDDRMGKIRIRAVDLDEDKFHTLLPEGSLFERINELTNVYLLEPMEKELELGVKSDQVQTTVLGEPKWSLLGYDTWMFSGSDLKSEAVVAFQL